MLILVFKYSTTNLQIILWLATKSTINVETFVSLMNVVCFRTFCDAFTAKELFARAVQKELALLNEICVLFEINI